MGIWASNTKTDGLSASSQRRLGRGCLAQLDTAIFEEGAHKAWRLEAYVFSLFFEIIWDGI
jgi:hypothetical protein